jgi:hypothetical protein
VRAPGDLHLLFAFSFFFSFFFNYATSPGVCPNLLWQTTWNSIYVVIIARQYTSKFEGLMTAFYALGWASIEDWDIIDRGSHCSDVTI